ncbi:LacI family DNA-binding transcriptional regulator [Aliirhizobium smilacinae]|uniref:LacI family DNA-binding transcriptional regulator n=1 Tax=Aliirhizobium smilacinae TaxID=1395944 RepID=A0A5C4XJ66_9HYPH|nr:LacI family DNA-binding transcriptional regulator [Rhizobium smilacinae]
MSTHAPPPKKLRKPRSSGAITLQEVAKLAGVSPITVSRALNRPEMVKPQKLEAIQAAIRRTGYVPNLLAGGLASKKSRLVAAMVPIISNSMFAEVIEKFTDRLDTAGYKVMLGLSGFRAENEDGLIAAVLSRQPDAIFLTGVNHSRTTRSRLLAARIPVVETWDYTPTPIDMLVGFSHEKVGRTVAEYLHDKGYRRFGMISTEDERANIRKSAFLATLAERDITDVRIATITSPGNFKKGRAGIIEILDAGELPEVVFCSSDVLAHSVLTEAQTRGMSVPADLAVIGFGDLEFAPYTFPALSTVHIDRSAIGLRAAEMVLARIEEREIEKIVDIGFSVIGRGST